MHGHFRALTTILFVAIVVIPIVGCDKNEDEREANSMFTASQPRPAALTAAAEDLKSNKPKMAEDRLQVFIKAEPKSGFWPEAQYMLGQSFAKQGDYEEAKKHLELAIDNSGDRTLKALAMMGRADCNLAMEKYSLASRQYHWIETMYREVKALPQDEVMYKLGLATKRAGFPDTADYWFNQVIELYGTGPYAADAKRENTKYNPPADSDEKPLVYSLEMKSFSDETKANAEADKLRAKGYRDVEVIATTQNSNPVYEVHCGKFFNKNDAKRAKTDCDLAGIPATIRPAIIEPLK